MPPSKPTTQIEAIARLADSISLMAAAYDRYAMEEREKVALLYILVVTGDPKSGVPSIVEVQRQQAKTLDNLSKMSWTILAAIIGYVVVQLMPALGKLLAGGTV